MDNELLINKFLDTLRCQNTKSTYSRELYIFAESVNNTYLPEVSRMQAQSYHDYLMKKMSSHEFAKSTVIKILRILMKFYSYLIDNMSELNIYIESNPFHNMSIPKQDIGLLDAERVLDTGELNKFLDVAKRNTRDLLMVLLMISARFTTLELHQLNWGNFFKDADDNIGVEVSSRGGSPRITAIREDVFKVLCAYRKERSLLAEFSSPEASLPVFVNQDNVRLSETSMRKVVYSICKKAGIEKKISPKDLSHICILLGMYYGASNQQLQTQANFSSDAILSKYTYSVSQLKNPACDVVHFNVENLDSDSIKDIKFQIAPLPPKE